jgi:hypothetical protein
MASGHIGISTTLSGFQQCCEQDQPPAEWAADFASSATVLFARKNQRIID